MPEREGHLDELAQQRRLERAALTFDEASFLHRQTFDGLLERLGPINLSPKLVVDLGAATGQGSQALAQQFRKATVLGVDRSARMLRQASKQRGWFRKASLLRSDAALLPLQNDSVDLIVANMLLPYVSDAPALLREVGRVLRPGGVFAFSALGPDSFQELRSAWATVDDGWHVNPFPDMHNIGDAVMAAGIADPVLDVDKLTVTYATVAKLYADLSSCGARNTLSKRRKTLTGKRRLLAMERALTERAQDSRFPMTLEIVYGHAWGAQASMPGGEYRVDPAAIGRRRR